MRPGLSARPIRIVTQSPTVGILLCLRVKRSVRSGSIIPIASIPSLFPVLMRCHVSPPVYLLVSGRMPLAPERINLLLLRERIVGFGAQRRRPGFPPELHVTGHDARSDATPIRTRFPGNDLGCE